MPLVLRRVLLLALRLVLRVVLLLLRVVLRPGLVLPMVLQLVLRLVLRLVHVLPLVLLQMLRLLHLLVVRLVLRRRARSCARARPVGGRWAPRCCVRAGRAHGRVSQVLIRGRPRRGRRTPLDRFAAPNSQHRDHAGPARSELNAHGRAGPGPGPGGGAPLGEARQRSPRLGQPRHAVRPRQRRRSADYDSASSAALTFLRSYCRGAGAGGRGGCLPS